MKSAAQQAYLADVHNQRCALCTKLGKQQDSPTEAHHPRDGQGMSQRAGDFCAIALCGDCHRGPQGIHGDRTLLRMAKVTEWDLHDITNEGVYQSVVLSTSY